MFYELQRVPEVRLLRFTTSSYRLRACSLCSCCSSAAEFWRPIARIAGLSTGEFFAASGAFFWRFLRLALFSLVPFGLPGAAYLRRRKASDYLGDKAVADQVGFVIWLAGVIVLVLLTLFVRLWFDLAKVHAVAHERAPHVAQRCGRASAISRRQVRTLLWMYLRISLGCMDYCCWSRS